MQKNERDIVIARISQDILKVQHVPIAQAEEVPDANGSMKVNRQVQPSSLLHQMPEHEILEHAVLFASVSPRWHIARISLQPEPAEDQKSTVSEISGLELYPNPAVQRFSIQARGRRIAGKRKANPERLRARLPELPFELSSCRGK